MCASSHNICTRSMIGLSKSTVVSMLSTGTHEYLCSQLHWATGKVKFEYLSDLPVSFEGCRSCFILCAPSKSSSQYLLSACTHAQKNNFRSTFTEMNTTGNMYEQRSNWGIMSVSISSREAAATNRISHKVLSPVFSKCLGRRQSGCTCPTHHVSILVCRSQYKLWTL